MLRPGKNMLAEGSIVSALAIQSCEMSCARSLWVPFLMVSTRNLRSTIKFFDLSTRPLDYFVRRELHRQRRVIAWYISKMAIAIAFRFIRNDGFFKSYARDGMPNCWKSSSSRAHSRSSLKFVVWSKYSRSWSDAQRFYITLSGIWWAWMKEKRDRAWLKKNRWFCQRERFVEKWKN